MNARNVVPYALLFAATAVCAAPATENEPTLTLKDFKGAPAASGANYRIADSVPVKGYLGQFTVTGGGNSYTVDGVELLRIRVAEMPALAKLEEVSKSDVFVDALGKSAVDTGKAVGRAVTNPIDTVSAIPAGVGRFFSSAGKSVQRAASSSAAGDSTGAAKDAVGVNKAKRAIAEPLGLDPYTRNPAVAKRLDDLAWATVAGGATLNVAMFAATAGAVAAISATSTVSKLAWSLPPADVRKRNEAKLTALGVDASARSALLDNAFYTPTLALDYAAALEALAPSKGAQAFTALAADAQSEAEARFYINQLKLAKQAPGGVGAALEARGNIGALRTADGVFLPVPLDYLSHTDTVARFLARDDLGSGTKTVWLTGAASAQAREALGAAGWTLREGVAIK